MCFWGGIISRYVSDWKNRWVQQKWWWICEILHLCFWIRGVVKIGFNFESIFWDDFCITSLKLWLPVGSQFVETQAIPAVTRWLLLKIHRNVWEVVTWHCGLKPDPNLGFVILYFFLCCRVSSCHTHWILLTWMDGLLTIWCCLRQFNLNCILYRMNCWDDTV